MRYSSDRFKWRGLTTLTAILLISGSLMSGCDSAALPAEIANRAPESAPESAQAEEAVPAAAVEAAQAVDNTGQDSAEAEPAADIAVDTAATQAEVAQAQPEAEPEPEVAAADTSSSEALSSISEDFTLVGTTGRPQLVYTYADW